jgi:two-component system, NtrC family, nitrogen regulation sensor histidine kinase NtrY
VQVFHVSHRQFLLNGQPHRLRLLKQLTREINAQEVAVWKKVIRVIAHEINNSVAPIASLAQSGQRLALQPGRGATAACVRSDRRAHVAPVAVRGRLFALCQAAPAAERGGHWRPFLQSLQAVTPFTVTNELPSDPGWFDESQLEQVVINLLKNAPRRAQRRMKLKCARA